MDVRLFNENENPPMDLLILADPSQKIVENYLNKKTINIESAHL